MSLVVMIIQTNTRAWGRLVMGCFINAWEDLWPGDAFSGLPKSFLTFEGHLITNFLHRITNNYLKCSLGLELINANVSGKMAQLMISNQQKHVPCLESDVISPAPFHGGQLFEERSRNVKWTFRVVDSRFDRLDGITPELADWHAKVSLYKVYL